MRHIVRPRRPLLSLIVIAAVALSAACEPPRQGTVRVAFIDGSQSTRDQADRWLAAVEAQIIQPIGFGDSVRIFGITDRTGERQPLFQADIPRAGDMYEEARALDEIARAKAGASEAVRRFLSESRPTPQTRIFEGIRLIPAPGAHDRRPVTVLYATDALESTPATNLERLRLTDPAAVAQQVAEAHGLQRGQLEGVLVAFVLDSPREGQAPHLNSRRELEALYRALFETHLGARLVSFDASVQTTSVASTGFRP